MRASLRQGQGRAEVRAVLGLAYASNSALVRHLARPERSALTLGDWEVALDPGKVRRVQGREVVVVVVAPVLEYVAMVERFLDARVEHLDLQDVDDKRRENETISEDGDGEEVDRPTYPTVRFSSFELPPPFPFPSLLPPPPPFPLPLRHQVLPWLGFFSICFSSQPGPGLALRLRGPGRFGPIHKLGPGSFGPRKWALYRVQSLAYT